MSALIDEILSFWFGENPDDAQVAAQMASLWWGKERAADEEISQRFGSLVLDAEAGRLSEWLNTPRGSLALILLTDQFPRAIYRDQPMAFHFDAVARWFCLEGIAHGLDRRLRPIHRVFYYLPLEHAEDLSLQQRCVTLFQTLLDEVPDSAKPSFGNFLQFAQRHQDIIRQFGRFPHRNEVLGRQSSADEAQFLRQPNSSF